MGKVRNSAVAYRVVRLGLLLGVTWLTAAGCYTVPLWKDATGRELKRPTLCGAMREPGQDGGVRQLLVSYSNRSEFRDMFAIHLLPDYTFYFVVPTDDEGRPISPFNYDGVRRRWTEMNAEVPSGQRQATQEAILTRISADDARRMMAAPEFVGGEGMLLRNLSEPWRIRRKGVSAWVYSPASQWRDAAAKGDPAHPTEFYGPFMPPGASKEQQWRATTNPVLRPDANVVLLPATQPRPSLDRTGAIAGATLLAPAAFVVDVVTVSVVAVIAAPFVLISKIDHAITR